METLGIIIAIVMLVLNLIGIIWLGIAIGHWFWTLVAYGVILGITFNIKKGYPGIIVLGIGALITLVVIIVCIVKAVNEIKSGKQQKELNNTLLNSVKEGNKQTVQELIEKGGNVNYIGYVSSDEKSLLEIAVENNDQEMVALLIEKGANVNLENGGITPLDCTENEEIIALLRSHGAKTQEEIEKELKEEQARKEEEERKEAERKKKEELEKETKYWQDLLLRKNRKLKCNGCKNELDNNLEVCPTCGKKIVTIVGKENGCNFSTIQEALDSVEEDAIIKVKPGIYEEHLHFSKKVRLIGCNDTIINKSSNELPIVVFDSHKSCEIDVPVEIEGIVFTHKKDLQFNTVSDLLKNTDVLENNNEKSSGIKNEESLFFIKSECNFVNSAILYSESNGVTFSDNKSKFDISFVCYSRFNGISIINNAEVMIDNSEICDSGFNGICIQSRKSSSIIFCKIFRNCEHGISIEPIFLFSEDAETSGMVISECRIYSNKRNGVRVNNLLSSVMLDFCNIFTNETGIAVVAETGKVIVNSCVILANKFGIIDSSKIETSYINCKIDSNECGIGCYDSSEVFLSGCDIHSNKHGVATVDHSSPKVSKCKIHDNYEYSIFCCENSSIFVADSEIYSNPTIAIDLTDDAFGFFVNCDVHDNLISVEDNSSCISKFDNCREWNNG